MMSGDERRRTERGRLFAGEERSEVQDELDFHLEQRSREYMAAGLDEEAARRAALERIGDYERVRGECADLLLAERRSQARRDWVSDLRQDVRFAVRGALRAPLFTLMAVLTLALGIGANSAVFGVVKSVLLDALPYADPAELVRIHALFDTQPDIMGSLSAGTVTDVIERQRSFESIAASVTLGPDAVLQSGDGAASVRLAWVQPEFFGVLGVSPALGRSFTAEEALPDTMQVVVMTHGLWMSRFGGDRGIIGRTIVLNGIAREVIGVLPQSYADPFGEPDVFMPLNVAPLLANPVGARGSHFLQLVARLRPGVSADAAAADIDGISQALVAEHPQDNRGIALRATPLHETMMGDTRTPLLVLMASAALVLLIACANLAGALLSRTIARRREFAVRVSLGAARGRLVRQLLAESILLAVVGGIAGLAIAWLGLAALANANLEALPDYARLSLDPGAVGFTFALALLTGAAFGLTPALSAGRDDPQAVLRDGSRGASAGRGAGRLRGFLVAGQVALCLSLLAGAGLLTRSLWLMASSPLGFDEENVLTFNVPLRGPRYATVEQIVVFRDEMIQRIGSLPGVSGVAVTSFLPTRVDNANGVDVVGSARDPNQTVPFVKTTNVSESFFDVLGIPLVAGRTFTTADRVGTPPVVVVSETMARRFWPDGDAIGGRIRAGPDPESTLEVVGIVSDVRTDMVSAQPEPMLYTPQRQGWWGTTFIVRTEGEPLAMANAVRRELAAYDAALPMAAVQALSDVIDSSLAARRLPMLLMLGFGGLALLLACIGIYALFANLAIAREREFGVRMALGSSRSDVAALVLREGGSWMAAGLVAGALGVYAVSRALQSLIYGIAPLDGISIAAAVVTLIIAAAITLAVPIVRATRTDPLTAMR